MNLFRFSKPVWPIITLIGFLCCGNPAWSQDEPTAEPQGEVVSHPPNRLVNETSPYLLKHAHNPVQWQPWDETALKQAADQNKVIFLSIGYSSCHWCHVMERESFMDDEIASFLNENFVCIKVDREERPDIDSIYMTSLNIYNQLTTGRASGGWPLSMFLTPDGRPFFGGTYFPARDGDRDGQPGFLTLARKVNEAWNTSRDRVNVDADRLTEYTRAELDGKREGDGGAIDAAWPGNCRDTLADRFDPQYGGFGFDPRNPGIPKFPESSNLFFLIDEVASGGDPDKAREMLKLSLQKMHEGGIHDHIGGGFHRYSTDRTWSIPHFEKMLYDNGQLLSVYSRAWELDPDPAYRDVAERIVEFTKREMTDPQGGFYSAIDAESEGVEGKFYRWSKPELAAVLDEEALDTWSRVYGVSGPPNFEEYYVPQLNRPLEEWAKQLDTDPRTLRQQLKGWNAALLDRRDQRPRPLTDYKILTGWNGLMIRGLADAGRIFDQPEYLEMAARSANFVWDNLLVEGRLKRTSTGGKVRLPAYLDDYAFYIDGLIALHQADGNPVWLERAARLQAIQDQLFWDEENAQYFFTASDHESLLARASDPTDGAMPAGSSVVAANLVYLADQLERPELFGRAERLVSGASGLLNDFPASAPRLLIPARELTK